MLVENLFHRHLISALGQCNAYQLWMVSWDQHLEVEPADVRLVLVNICLVSYAIYRKNNILVTIKTMTFGRRLRFYAYIG